jgi:nitroimidazol reductase NimA-like FMN-containing flavoprotein (pyridoxamine 5'-phosphate oxidase superfamily)
MCNIFRWLLIASKLHFMIGTLTKGQCQRVLIAGMIGRIGCHSAGKTYVIPITYVFDGGYIYAHSKDGLKIQMMRLSPDVCFQVDQVDNLCNWRSVVIWGKFEELTTTEEQESALKILINGLEAFHTGDSVKPPKITSDINPRKEKKPVIYRISIDEITGRYEKQ